MLFRSTVSKRSSGLVACSPHVVVQLVPLKTCISPEGPQSEHQINKPAAGFTIKDLCANVSLGSRRPCVVLLISRAADELGDVVPIPTPVDCADVLKMIVDNKNNRTIVFINRAR